MALVFSLHKKHLSYPTLEPHTCLEGEEEIISSTNSQISSKYTSRFLQQLWHLFLLLHLPQTIGYGRWSPQGATLALQPCHTMHRLSHQAGTNPRCPPTVAALTSPPWLGRVRDREAAHNTFLPTSKDCMNSPLHACVLHWGDGGGTIHPSHRVGLALVHGVTTICQCLSP